MVVVPKVVHRTKRTFAAKFTKAGAQAVKEGWAPAYDPEAEYYIAHHSQSRANQFASNFCGTDSEGEEQDDASDSLYGVDGLYHVRSGRSNMCQRKARDNLLIFETKNKILVIVFFGSTAFGCLKEQASHSNRKRLDNLCIIDGDVHCQKGTHAFIMHEGFLLSILAPI